VRESLEYAVVWPAIKLMGMLPRPVARGIGVALGLLVYRVHRRLREVGMRNLTLAFPGLSDEERQRLLRGEYISLGRQLAEFCLFPHYTLKNVSKIVVYDGLQNYEKAFGRGKGVLFLTGHLAHSLNGHPLSIVMRPLDNPYIDRLVQTYRTLHGNKTVSKDDFIRGLLAAMRAGESVGILMDTNMTPPQGVFVNFFGIPAYTASGLARIALRTDAAVLPGFTVWEERLGKYVLRFDPALELIRSGNDEADIVANTAMFTGVIEEHIRRYPDQWLWLHRRWKTRPEGDAPLY